MDPGPMDRDNIDTINHPSYDSFAPPDKWIDHVKWQGSQTACSALNQLIKSSVKETTTQEALRTSEWQRVSSYDQLSGLLSTGHHDTASSSLISSHSRPSSSKPSSLSRSHSRSRLSEAAPDITNLPIPSFFNKTNPMQFLDIMKGVSARLDENAGVRPRKDLNLGVASSSSSRTKKRSRGSSFGSTSELQAGKACGIFKKGRVDKLRTSTRDGCKGKRRATSEDEGLDSETRGRGLQAHSSLPDIHSRSDLKRSLSSKDVNFMDVDDKDDDMGVSLSAVSSSSDHDHPRTISQTEMPPPPFPYDSVTHKQRQSAADPPSTLTPLAVSRHSNSINKPQTSYPPQQPKTNYAIKQRKPDAVPKMHPLLYHKPATTKVSSPPMATSTPQAQPQPQPQRLSTSISVSEGANLKPLSSPIAPLPPSRPPALGMRRNRTFPSRTSSSSSLSVSSSLTNSSGQLPQRQKGFKPPLLSLSQPQAGTQPQTRDRSQVKTNANVILVEPGSTIATSNKASSQNSLEPSSTPTNTSMAKFPLLSLSQPQAGTQPRTRDLSQIKTNTNVIVVEPGSTIATSNKASSQNSLDASSTPTNTSMVLRTSTSSSSSSSASFQSTTSPSCSQSYSSDASDCSRLNNCNQGMAELVAPETLDVDTDSSFGDMSFDMDALEETMKMYD